MAMIDLLVNRCGGDHSAKGQEKKEAEKEIPFRSPLASYPLPAFRADAADVARQVVAAFQTRLLPGNSHACQHRNPFRMAPPPTFMY